MSDCSGGAYVYRLLLTTLVTPSAGLAQARSTQVQYVLVYLARKKQQCACVQCVSAYLHVHAKSVVCVYLICLYIVGRLVFTYVSCGCRGCVLRPDASTDNY